MTYLTNADVSFLSGNGPKALSQAPMIRKQGNGNFTGFVRTVWSDGKTSDQEFVVNAPTREEVLEAYVA